MQKIGDAVDRIACAALYKTRGSAIAEGPRDARCPLVSLRRTLLYEVVLFRMFNTAVVTSGAVVSCSCYYRTVHTVAGVRKISNR